jgi:hypothetical protein
MKPPKHFENSWGMATTCGFMPFLLMIPLSFKLLSLFRPTELEAMSVPYKMQQ